MASGKIQNKTSFSGIINNNSSLGGSVTAGSGTTDHSRLTNRSTSDQHPIEAITNLRNELDSKLDAATASPLIEEAISGKAKGLYFDAKKELNKKAYWYLTSEIDPVTKMGTKASVISGPYDLGAGGGGGGTGLTTISLQKENWLTTTVVGAKTVIQVRWASVVGENKEPTGPGDFYLSVNGKQVELKPSQEQGIVEFDISKYIVAGSNSVQVKVIDTYGTTSLTVGNINAVTLELKSSFNASLNYTDYINYSYVPYGDVDKVVHFILDGTEIGSQNVKSTGESQTYKITGLKHGSHKLEVYFTAEINGVEVTSNTLYYDLVYYVKGNTTPIIVSTFRDLEQEQYIAFNIPYRVYIDGRNTFEVSFLVNGEEINRTSVGTADQQWNYVNNTPGVYELTIKCGTTTKTFKVHIKETTIKVTPVEQDLQLALSTQGRNNNEEVYRRNQWKDEKNNIECTLTDFNWKSNGWVSDSDGNTVLRVSGDARVNIPFKVFTEDFKNAGKTIELEIATSAVRNYSTTLISCLDKQSTDFYESSTSFAEEDFRRYTFKVTLDTSKLTITDPETKETSSKLTPGSHVFSYTSNGWMLDSETLVDIADYGIAIGKYEINPEGTHEDEFLLVGDNIIINYTKAARGFYVTPQVASFRSQQSYISTQYKEDEHVRLTFVVERNTENRIIWMYINGIASGAMQYPIDDNFRQLEPDIIKIGSNDATLDIYNIRIYENSLTSKQVVNNWIADTQNVVLKATRYTRNDNYNDKNEIVMTKLPTGLPYMVWDIQPLPEFKGDKRLGNAIYIDPKDSSRNFKSGRAQYNVQGTSSSVYPTKNIRIKFKAKDDDPEFFWIDDNDNTISKFPITYPGGIGDNYFTFKVDYASSEGANNVELTKLYNDTCKELNILTPPQRLDARVRVGIDGFPIAAFYRDENGKDSFCTKANFNNDKANEKVYGFISGDESWETTNNSAAVTKYKVPATETNFEDGFEIRFPDSDDWNGDVSKLKAMTTWVVSTNPDDATDELLEEEVTYTYEEISVGEDGSESKTKVTKTFTHDTEEYRLTRFRVELPNWFNVDSTLFYYVFTHLYLMIDSRAKNAFPTYFKSRAAGDGGDRWFWIPYDMDTAIGIDNKGKLSFDYNLEDTDKLDGADVFNGQDSVMWCNLRRSMPGEIKAMYAKMRLSKLISYEETERRFEEHQGQWSENIFNEDAKNKYVVPLANGDNYLEMLQGSKAQQRKWWLYNRFKYMDSKYNAGEAIKDFIQFRAYVDEGQEKPNITITPYADIYATVSYANGRVVAKRAKRNEQIIIENPFGITEKENDQETYIYSASQLKSIGDISGFHPDTVKIGNAVKLQELKVGDASPSYSNPYLKELTVGNNTLLKSLDARNCINLGTGVTTSPDLSSCVNIEEIYFTGTKIKGVVLPDGGNIKKLHLPGTLTSLIIKNQPLLTELNIEGNNTSLDVPVINLDGYVVTGHVSYITEWVAVSEESGSAEVTLTDDTNEVTFTLTDKTIYDLLVPADKSVTPVTELVIAFNQMDVRFDLIEGETVTLAGFKLADITTISAAAEGASVSLETAIAFATENAIPPVKEDYGISLIESLWLENIPATSIKSETMVGRMKANTAVRLIGINETYNNYEEISHFYDILDTKRGLTADGNTVDKAQVTGTINVNTILYNDKCKLEARYPEIKINATTVVCVVTFITDETDIPLVQNVAQGTSAIAPATPVKEPTQQHYYVFDKWIYNDGHEWTPEDIIESDTVLTAVYLEKIQEYTVQFNPNSDLITVEPLEMTVYYDSYIKIPTMFNIPEGVELEGWYMPNGTKWDFDIHKLVDDIILTAKWKDENEPTVSITVCDATHFRYEASDNLGIVAWAVTVDSEEPSWNSIQSTTNFTGTYEVTRAGINTFWIKDSNNNTASASVTVYPIDITKDIGVLSSTLQEVATDCIINSVAIDGTLMTVSAVLDSHYKNLNIKVNNNPIELTTTIKVDRNILIYLSCEPKQYTVSFDLDSKGVAIPTQTITYLHTVTKPLSQYWQPTHEVIIGWYLDKAYTTEWDFEHTKVLEDTTIYAKWSMQRNPSILTIVIPDDAVKNAEGKYEIEFTYTNKTSIASELVRVDFGDGVEHTSNMPDPISIKYYYDTTGEKTIKVFGNNKGYSLGYGLSAPIVKPANYLIRAELAWDISRLGEHMFKDTSITEAPLTEYITSIGANCFENCTELKTVNLPRSLLEIGSNAFTGCNSLNEVLVLPLNLIKIGDSAFSGCTSLKTVDFSNSNISIIDQWAFSGCTKLENLDIPATVESIGTSCFAGCTNLSKVILRNENLIFGSYVFNNCINLVTAGPIGAVDYEGYPLNIEYAWKYTIPDFAFATGANQSGLMEVVLPATLKEIGKNAFQNAKISAIELPSGLQTIKEKAFVYCKLRKISVPASVMDIGYGAFSYCRSLTDIQLYLTSSNTKIDLYDQGWFLLSNSAALIEVPSSILQVEEGILPEDFFGEYWNIYNVNPGQEGQEDEEIFISYTARK